MKTSLHIFLVSFLFFTTTVNADPPRIIIKSFSLWTKTAARALQFSVDEINQIERNGNALPSISYDHHEVYFGSSWSFMNSVCDELKEGAMMLITIDSGKATEAMKGLANNLEMPMITLAPPAFPPNHEYFFDISLRPSPTEVLADFIIMKQWTDIIVFSDDENSGLSLSSLYRQLYKKTALSITSQLLELPVDPIKFDDFLIEFNAKRSNHTNRILIDTTSSVRLYQFLIAIRSARFSQTNYHYVIANFDFLPYDVQVFQNGNINISGFQLINKESRVYSNLKKLLKKEKFYNRYDDVDIHAALAHDSMIVAWKAFSKCLAANDSLFDHSFNQTRFYNRGYPGIYCYPQPDRNHPMRPFDTFEHGETIAKALRELKVDTSDGTLTGLIEFDRFGHRKNYDVSVIDLVSDTNATFKKEVSTWRQGVGFLKTGVLARQSRQAVRTRNSNVVRVATVLVAPFVMYKRDCVDNMNRTECEGNKKYEGYCIDLLTLMADKIDGFKYEIHVNNKFGSRQADGSWDGMIGELLNGKADMAVSSLTINQDRERVVDFSKPFMSSGISIMIKKPDRREFSIYSFLQPLSSETWIYIILAYIGVSLIIFLVSRFSPSEWRTEDVANGGTAVTNDFSICNSLWFTLASFMQQTSGIYPRSISGRIASSVWWFFTLIIVASYISNLTAFLILEKQMKHTPIESVEDLVKQTHIKYGIQKGGSTAGFFRHSSVPIYQRMWRHMESQDPSVFVTSYAEGINRVRSEKGRYAFLLESHVNDFENNRKPCDTMRVGANLNTVGYGIATPFGSEWKQQVNLAILALNERGDLKKLENKWWYDRGQCDQGTAMDGHPASLNLSKVAGLFYILIVGMIVSIIAALGELLYRSVIESRKSNSGSFVSVLRSQLCLSIKGSVVSQPGTQSNEPIQK